MKSNPKPSASGQERIKRHIFYWTCLIFIGADMFHTALTLLGPSGLTPARITGFAAGAVFVALPFFEMRVRNLRVSGAILISTMLAGSAYVALKNGGVTAPTTPFLMVTPIAAGLFVGRRAALLSAGAATLMLLLLTVATVYRFVDASPYTETEMSFLRLSGFFWAVFAASAITFGHGRIALSTIAELDREIANHAASEKRLARKTREYDQLFENLPVRLWVKDDKNTIIRLNEAAAAAMGVSKEEAEGANTGDLFPETAEKYLQDDLAVIRSGRPKLGILDRHAPLSGENGWARTNKAPFKDSETGQDYVIVASIDVSEQKRAEDALAESEIRFSTAAEGSSVGIWDWVDVSRDEQYWTPRQYELLGYGPGEIPASLSAFIAMLHPDDVESAMQAVRKHFLERKPLRTEYRLKHKTGGYRWFLATGQAIWDEAGRPVRMIGSIMDIHDQKLAEEALVAKAQELERSNQELDRFAHVASHDLKAPLRGVGNIVNWLEEDLAGVLDDQSREHLTLLKGRVARLEKLLDDLLAYARPDIGGEIEDVNLKDIVDAAFGIHTHEGITLRVAGDLPMLRANPAPLEIVLRNLVENAAKHHDREEGGVIVSAADIGDFVEIRVADDGPGIASEHHARIFEMFQTLQSRDEVEGSGMGLAMVKKIVERHGGAIRVISDPSKRRGSVFVFTWPKQAAGGARQDFIPQGLRAAG